MEKWLKIQISEKNPVKIKKTNCAKVKSKILKLRLH